MSLGTFDKGKLATFHKYLIDRYGTSITLIGKSGAKTAQILACIPTTMNPSRASTSQINQYEKIYDLFGIRNHPTEPDSNIEIGDTFVYEGVHMEVQSVDVFPSSIQAKCEVI